MLLHVPEQGSAFLVCEECGARLLLLPENVPIVSVWRNHARVCPEGCTAPPPSAKYLKLTRLASG